ncbi:shikimate kinase [Nitratireductor indicus C115]|uniref:Shikimate kinase n=1 Tax=Nitratireductor indicus C115 TaxID=1231190 RepID=K2P3P6_9HYPH|nr:shikimate kinase [Nitratireductor indicus]EKF42006.1 shikimate kinase [Nitratireductor indicus C115]SFQ47156.1 shikimate kinase [Nitratireductor indicus]
MTVTETPASTKFAGIAQKLGNRSIVFVGLMGAGKTVIGRKVAEMLGLAFIDSDHEIETVSRMTVADLFSSYGEAEFRSLERRVIARLLKSGPRVVSTGGGAFVNAQTRRAVARRGISIWLKADLPTLMERVGRKSTRPLLNNQDPESVMRRLMDERYPLYAEADIVVHSRNEPKDVIAGEVVDALAQYLENDAHAPREGTRGNGDAK